MYRIILFLCAVSALAWQNEGTLGNAITLAGGVLFFYWLLLSGGAPGGYGRWLSARHIYTSDGKLYLTRWALLPRNRIFNLYLHRFSASDPQDLHDHPWASFSVMLKGRMSEKTPAAAHDIRAGHCQFRPPTYQHALRLISKTAWTLFITGPVVRSWFFYPPNEKVHFRAYLERPKTAGRSEPASPEAVK